MRPSSIDTSRHLFCVGQTVRFRNRMDRPPLSAPDFKITRTLPAVGGQLQYRLRSDTEAYERVATQDRLELVDPAVGGRATLARRVFGSD